MWLSVYIGVTCKGIANKLATQYHLIMIIAIIIIFLLPEV